MTRAAGKFGLHRPATDGDDAWPVLSGPLAAPTVRLAAVDVVRARVTASIALGVLAPGERLPDPEVLADALDVSLITVRRALESLCREGVLDRRRGRTGGTFVSSEPDPARLERTPGHRDVLSGIRALVGQRLVVECGVAALAAGHDPGTGPGAADLLLPDGEVPGVPGAPGLAAVELDFHLRLARLVVVDGVPVEGVADQVRSTIGQLAAYLPAPDPARLDLLAREHRRLAEAVAAGDGAAAVALMRGHVEGLHRHQAAAVTPARS